MTDVLFVTRIGRNRDSGSGDVFKPLRMEVDGQTADLLLLRAMAAGRDVKQAAAELERQRAAQRLVPVLTPFYMEDYLRRRGISMTEIGCLDDETGRVKEFVRDGVRVIAICTTWVQSLGQAEEVRRAVRLLRSLAPGVPIVAGGMGVLKGIRTRQLLTQDRLDALLPMGILPRILPGALIRHVARKTLSRHMLLLDPRADGLLDAMVIGEGGEAALAAIAQRLRDGRDFRDLPNLVLPDPRGFRFTPQKSEEVNLDAEIVDWRRYAARLDGHEALVRTGAGCPFQCGFCDFRGLERMCLRSPESLVAELRTLAEALPAPRRVFFVGDNLGASRRHLAETCRAIIREKLQLSWRGFLRADVIDPEIASLMAESGCRECLLGIESGSPDILANMNKRLDPERALRGIESLDAAGIGTLSTFVVGFPGENETTIGQTVAFISAIPSGTRARALHRYYLFRLIVSPLSPVAGPEQRKRFGLEGIIENWRHRTMSADGARAAIRDIFMRVRGPSHIYMETIPEDWPVAQTRRVIELRDQVQKERLAGTNANGLDRILKAVAEATPEIGTLQADVENHRRSVSNIPASVSARGKTDFAVLGTDEDISKRRIL
ncbi:MAG: radical SAM protein [Planctomycetota bacterium]